MKKSYQVVEDNGGGLTLFVFNRSNRVEAAFSGYEYNQGHLVNDLDALDNGSDASDWESHEDDPKGLYDRITSYQYGWQIVASGKNGKRTLYPDKMGAAARLEFGID